MLGEQREINIEEKDCEELLQEAVQVIESRENQTKKALWDSKFSPFLLSWYLPGVPNPSLQNVPFVVQFEIPMWSQILRFNVKKYYTDPETQLRAHLAMIIYRFHYIKDDLYLTKNIPIYLGVPFESAFFGVGVRYMPDDDPWSDVWRGRPIIQNEKDLGRLAAFDFYKNGQMPLAHEFYGKIREIAGDTFSVGFPIWRTGPFGVVVDIHGLENTLIDSVSNPKLVHKLMQFVTFNTKKWWENRRTFLGKKEFFLPIMGNDAVNCPIVSPRVYEEFVLPYEKELSEFHGGIGWWHTCGNITPLFSLVSQGPSIRMLDVNTWTDELALSKALEDVKENITLLVRFHPVEGVLRASELKMRFQLEKVVEMCRGRPFLVRASSLQVLDSLDRTLDQIQKWIRIARQVLKT